MGKSSSKYFRDRIVGEIERDVSRHSAARRFGVSAATAVRLAQRKALTGSVAPARQGRPPGSGRLAAHVAVLIAWVDAEGDVTMPELAARLLAERGVKAHPASLSRLLRAEGYTVKKTLLASETDRADVVRARHIWQVHRQPWMKKRPDGWRSSIDRDDDEDDTLAGPLAPGPAAEDEGAVRSLGNADLHRETAL